MVNLIAYGCFINRKSLEKTIPWREPKIVKVEGYKRVFNLIPSRLNLYEGVDKIKRTVFNVVKDETNSFNALMFQLDDDEFEKLKIRERSYNLKKIKIGEEEAFLFVGKQKLYGEEILNNDLLPIPSYLKLCMEGAKSFGDEFFQEWKETSFLGNGTSIKEYLKEEDL